MSDQRGQPPTVSEAEQDRAVAASQGRLERLSNGRIALIGLAGVVLTAIISYGTTKATLSTQSEETRKAHLQSVYEDLIKAENRFVMTYESFVYLVRDAVLSGTGGHIARISPVKINDADRKTNAAELEFEGAWSVASLSAPTSVRVPYDKSFDQLSTLVSAIDDLYEASVEKPRLSADGWDDAVKSALPSDDNNDPNAYKACVGAMRKSIGNS